MMKWYDYRIWSRAIILLIVGLAVLALSGCRTKYITVPEYHTEYIVRSDTVASVDSVLLHDSVFVYHSGDTVIINKVAYRDRWRNVYKVRTDTLLRRDSVYVPTPTTQTLSKTGWRLTAVGMLATAVVFLVIGFFIATFFWYHNKKC